MDEGYVNSRILPQERSALLQHIQGAVNCAQILPRPGGRIAVIGDDLLDHGRVSFVLSRVQHDQEQPASQAFRGHARSRNDHLHCGIGSRST